MDATTSSEGMQIDAQNEGGVDAVEAPSSSLRPSSTSGHPPAALDSEATTLPPPAAFPPQETSTVESSEGVQQLASSSVKEEEATMSSTTMDADVPPLAPAPSEPIRESTIPASIKEEPLPSPSPAPLPSKVLQPVEQVASSSIIPSLASTPAAEASSSTIANADSSSSPAADLNLPPGLNSSSPSVVRETVAVAAHLKDPEEPNPLLALISSATAQSELEDARAWYEAFLKIYPTAAPQLLSYAELELSHDNYQQVEALFSRAFAKSSSAGPAFPLAYPPLWTSYLHYIRRRNPLEPVPPSLPNLPSTYLNARLTITKAYDFALDHIGLDSLSTPIWKEYLQFIKEGETRTTWEEQGKVAELRKVYTRVLKVPVEDVEGIWREYDMFEGGVNKITAKKFLAERSPAYMTARSTLKELRTKRPPSAAVFPPPLPLRPTWTNQDRTLVAAWKAYIEWEMSNPLELEEEDEVKARVGYVLRKTVGGECRFFPEIWYVASNYSQSLGKIDEAIGFLKSGVEANPSSFLLTFALAELYESPKKDFAATHSLFSSLLGRLQPTLERTKASITSEIAAAIASVVDTTAAVKRTTGNHLITDPSEPDLAEVKRALEEERKTKAEEVRVRRERETEEMEKGVALAWIMWMRFARRAEGIKSARAIFQKARKAPHLAWQVYEAAAVTEYHCSKEPSVATRIFELGLKVYGDKIDFVDRYLSFLITINDDQNARVLFEKSVAKFTPEIARPLWERWARYEYLFGDIASAQRLDLRFGETFPGDSATKNLGRRHTYMDIDEIARVDLGFGTQPTPSSSKPTPTGPRAPESYLVAPPIVEPTPAPAPPPPAVTVAASSPAKRPLYSDLESANDRHQSQERDVGPSSSSSRTRRDSNERLSMRNQPASSSSSNKRMRAASPVVAAPMAGGGRRGDQGWGAGAGAKGREVSPMVAVAHQSRNRERSPPPHVRGQPPQSQVNVNDGSLHWFLGELPPAGAFDGPVFRTEDLMTMIGNSAIVPVYPQAARAAAAAGGVPPPAEHTGGRGSRRGWGP